MRILSNPERVCSDHGMEFWTGLLVYARDSADARQIVRSSPFPAQPLDSPEA
jgi:hypothetical protein